ncbi:hypothetical protein SBOR_5071 [Sclerotinia borealis F-4128]|uniref:Uncharacterized protein n=1 Tax=Sclerotinia borealis (strain F-4128) TaxID=1432307 RepID=W9CF48_SCLBF|nr:hypothetical protein SBOR_5071 [Sclerotinia borealis F-4128]
MILMEGLMLVPPERGTIIGRALWKSRYVVLGSGAHLQTQTDILEKSNSKKGKSIKTASSKQSLADFGKVSDEGLFISIYKAKGDWEHIAQHPISAFKSCDIRSLSHRKQATPLPTLMLEMKPDSISEKQRKRRSSRTGGLTSNKDAQWADTLLFRSVPEDRNNIYDWQITIKPRLQVDENEETPMSPLSPIFTSFTNPFSPRDPRPSSRNGRQDQPTRPPFQSVGQYSQTPRDRPSALISPSPSLRSRRSDLSSQASSSHPPMGFTSAHPQNFNNTTLPTDLPSPISVSGYDNFIEGWTSAQGRSSALSHHTRGSNSIASAIAPLTSPITTSPGPRETILDRAFQMRCIPGSERLQDREEDKISSIARFEALMREHDERLLQRSATSATDSHGRYKPGWELEEESEESDNEDPGADVLEQLDGNDIHIPTPAQRALDYIAGRQTPLPRTSSSSSSHMSPNSPLVPFLNRDAMSALHSGSSSTSQSFSSIGNGLRPRTGTTSSHMRKNSRPSSLALPPRSISTTAVPSLKDNGSSGLVPSKAEKEKRRSSTSTKRLSFQEFARRLSSTSSLLLVQTNASSNSGRGDSFRERDDSRRGSVSDHELESPPELVEEGDFEGRRGGLRSSNGLSMRGGDGQSVDRDMAKRCGRGFGGMGVFGGEGGFL